MLYKIYEITISGWIFILSDLRDEFGFKIYLSAIGGEWSIPDCQQQAVVHSDEGEAIFDLVKYKGLRIF